MTRGQALYTKARTLIPGGTQLLSKRPEMFLPEQWPSYYTRARGVEVWDLDRRRFIDMCYSGIGACVLGYADPDVDEAVRQTIATGSMTTLNCPEEIELAELLCTLHPWAGMVRYARGGGEAMAVAVRIARAATGRDKVAFCGYHGWHDWYLAANLGATDALDGHLLPGLAATGVPRGLAGSAIPFRYNRLDDLQAIVSDSPDLAAIVMEPVRSTEPEKGFLESVRTLASDIGAALIFDEVTSGWRLNSGGAHLVYGVEPDIAVFAKGISNGYPMAAIIGRERVMQAAQNSFISSTSWSERIGPTAALATIGKFKHCEVSKHLVATGQQVLEGWREVAATAGISITFSGIAPLAHFSFDYPNDLELRTLFTQRMLEYGFLAKNAFYATYAHQDFHISSYLDAVEEIFVFLSRAIEQDLVSTYLKGPVAHAGFYRLT